MEFGTKYGPDRSRKGSGVGQNLQPWGAVAKANA